MIKIYSLYLTIAIIFLTLTLPINCLVKSDQLNYYVDGINGNDQNSGLTVTQPWRSLEHAKDFIQRNKGTMNADIVVNIRQGIYRLTNPIEFSFNDSGNNNFNIIYQAYQGEDVEFMGGDRITGWELHDAEKNIYKAFVGEHRFRQLYVNGKRAIRARYPNLLDETLLSGYFSENASTTTEAPYKFNVQYEELSPWSNLENVEVVMVDHWKQKRARISSYHRYDEMASITFLQPEGNSSVMNHYAQTNTPHFYENSYDFIDMPNEWYLDEESKTLYYKPDLSVEITTLEFVMPIAENLLLISGENSNKTVKNLRFKDLIFSYTNWTQPSDLGYLNFQAGLTNQTANNGEGQYIPGAIEIKFSEDIIIDGCIIKKTGAHGIMATNTVKNSRFTNNTITDTAGGGIYLNLTNQASEGNVIQNNLVEFGGMVYTDAVGIFAQYAPFTTIKHNHVRFYRYSGISTGWNWTDGDTVATNHEISYNLVHHVSLLHDDGGGIYTMGKIPNMSIHNNYIYGVKASPFNGGYSVAGIYLDNGSTLKNIFNNVIEDCTKSFYAKNLPNYENVFRGNYFNSYVGEVLESNVFIENTQIDGTDYPKEGQEIIYNAGINGRTPTVTNDFMDNWNYIASKSAGLTITHCQPEFNDTSILRRNNFDTQFISYHRPGISSVAAIAFYPTSVQPSEHLNFYISENGIDWTSYLDWEAYYSTTNSNMWTRVEYQLKNLVSNTNYIKIEIPLGEEYYWKPLISSVQISHKPVMLDDFRVSSTTFSNEDDNLLVSTVALESNSFSKKTAAIFLALYDSQNQLTGASLGTLNFNAPERKASHRIELALPENYQDHYARLFVWENNGAMKPIPLAPDIELMWQGKTP